MTADLIDSHGGIIARQQRVFSLRTLDAGTYYLRMTRQVLGDRFDTDLFATSYFAENSNDTAILTHGRAFLDIGGGRGNFIWTGGQTLANVGDSVRVDFGYNYPLTDFGLRPLAGLRVFSSPTGGFVEEFLVESNRQDGSKNTLLVGQTSVGLRGAPTNTMNLRLEVLSTGPSSMDLGYTLSGEGFDTITGTHTVNTTEAFIAIGGSHLFGFDAFFDDFLFQPVDVALQPERFEIDLDAPLRGADHETATSPDRDEIRGGGGDDILVGNQGLDRIIGGSGADLVTSEFIEFKDPDPADFGVLPVSTNEVLAGNFPIPIDPMIEINDLQVEIAVAQAVGNPVTQSESPNPITHEVIRESDLARIESLTVDGATSLQALRLATSLQSLTLKNSGQTSLSASELSHLVGLSLTSLDLTSQDEIDTVATLAGLDTLESLKLSGTRVNRVGPSTLELIAANPLTELVLPTVSTVGPDQNLVFQEGDEVNLPLSLGAVSFNGMSSHIDFSSNFVGGGSEFTVSSWVRKTSAAEGAIFSSTGVTSGHRFTASENQLRFTNLNGGVVYTAELTTPLPIGEWVHLAAVYDSNRDVTFYVNGEALPKIVQNNTFAFIGQHILYWQVSQQQSLPPGTASRLRHLAPDTKCVGD